MVNLYTTLGPTPVRPDERFHLQRGQPSCTARGQHDGFYRRITWNNLALPDGTPYGSPLTPGRFSSTILLWVFRWYRGTVKCDGTRTYAYQAGLCGDPFDNEHYVMTTTPKELFSVRLRWRKPDRERWDNMGGI